MTTRIRVAVFVAVIAVALVGAGAYLWQTRSDLETQRSATVVDTRDDLAALSTQPHLVFRSTALDSTYGNVAVVPLDDPQGPRAVTDVACERVYATADEAICLSAERGVLTTYAATIYDRLWARQQDLPMNGIPSRARLSRDGALAATTSFISGHSYAAPGQFSTETVVTRLGADTYGNLEEFTLIVDGQPYGATDRNLWGVTFVDDDTFYATAASGDTTWLVEGSLSSRTLTALATDVECPSLSPNGTRVAFKRRGDLPPGQWRVAVRDLATGVETLTAETRSVDDQVEWLDDETLVYGLPRTGAASAETDVWQVPADGTGEATVLIPQAWSPAVVR